MEVTNKSISTDAFQWVKRQPQIDGSLMTARGTGRILDSCGRLANIDDVGVIVRNFQWMFNSECPYKLPSEVFNFTICETKFQIVQVDHERISASSKNRQKHIIVENMCWGLVIILFSAPNQFGSTSRMIDLWAREHRG